MEFQTLRKSNTTKKVVIALVLFIALGVTILMLTTRAKYKLVESVPLANGTINYTLVDFELAGIKFKASGSQDYGDVSTIEDNYEFNQGMSYCTEKYSDGSDNFKDVRNNNLAINFDKENKTISIKPYSKKGTKCYLFFDEEKQITSEDVLKDTLKQSSKGQVDKFSGTACGGSCDITTQNGIYEAEDDYGTSYYYRGTVDNNWLVFGQDTTNKQYIWWRIIRINGNGSIRIMYAGTSNSKASAPSTTGNTTMIKPKTNTNRSDFPNAVYFNQTSNDNKYVGYMYPGEKGKASTDFDGAHKVDNTSTKSDALTQIESWYNQDTNLGTLAAQYIDVDTGFCSDSTVSIINHGSNYPGTGSLGFGSNKTAYAGTDRVWQSGSTSTLNPQTPTLKCGYTVSTQKTDENARKRDLYTGPGANVNGTKGSNGTTITGNNALPVPVGLITMDEVIYAGGFFGKANANYWLKTDKYYWTMSPFYFYGSYADVFNVADSGYLSHGNTRDSSFGVRPVINLKASTAFTFDNTKPAGTTTNPYVVEAS